MADRIRFSVNITPIETLTDENSGSHDIIASEVNRSLGGSGDSVNIDNYGGTAANQGYKDATVNYLSISHSAGGTALSATDPDFVFVKNTGYKYSAATTLGASTTDCIMVVARLSANTETQAGWATANLAGGQIQYLELGWLKPGQGMVIPLGARSLSVTQFGSNTGDLSRIADDTEYGGIEIYLRTFQSNGSATSSANALEYLVVT